MVELQQPKETRMGNRTNTEMAALGSENPNSFSELPHFWLTKKLTKNDEATQ